MFHLIQNKKKAEPMMKKGFAIIVMAAMLAAAPVMAADTTGANVQQMK